MRIQPITSYSASRNFKIDSNSKRETITQPNFNGLKGTVAGTAVGAGLTAAGVAIIAGVAALPVFLGYIVTNGVISGLTGHLIQDSKNE